MAALSYCPVSNFVYFLSKAQVRIVNKSKLFQVLNKILNQLKFQLPQVQQLQVSMRDILNCMTVFAQLQHSNNNNMTSSSFKDSSETQTEIVAVHTPQIEQPKDFPFVPKVQRPCSLPITSSSNESSATSAKSSSALNDECNGSEPVVNFNETI